MLAIFVRRFLLAAAIAACFASAMPFVASAVGSAADAMCNPVKMECGCMMIMTPKGCKGGPNMFMCPCFDVTSGFTTSGVCMAPNKCKGESAGGMPPMLPMIPMMMPMMDMMMPCMQPVTGNGGGTASTSSSTPQQDPCGYGGGYDFGQPYFQSTYYDPGDSSTTDQVDYGDGGTQDYIVTATGTVEKPGPKPLTPTTTGGLTGAIKIGNAGATIVANLRQGLTEVAGFFGGNVVGNLTARSIVGRMCALRPWARSNFISRLIPDSFFDALCAKAGYQVGVAQPQQQGGGPIQVIKKRTDTGTNTKAPPMNLGPVSVDIWAEPAVVRLGTRTYIFWNAKGVLDCTVTGPNFTQKSLSGGASTVPITGPTTYNLECNAPDGSKAKDSVTVTLQI